MEILCRCAECSTQFKVDAKYAGRKARCPKCTTITIVPAESLPDAASSAQRRGRFLESQATEAGITSPDFPELAGLSSSTAAPAGRGAAARTGKTSAADTTPISIQIDVKKPAAPKPTDASGKPRTKLRKKTPPLLWIIGGGLVGGVVLVIVITAVLARAWQPANPKLVLDWPEAERSDAQLLLNKKKVAVPKTGAVEFTVSPGENTFTIQRRGYKPIDQPFSVSKGTTLRKKVEWEKISTTDQIATINKGPTPPVEISADGPQGFSGWLQLLETATKEATAKKKDIFMVFSGSDWSPASIKMSNDIFSNPKFRKSAERQFILVVIDAPKTDAGVNMLANVRQNVQLRRQYQLLREKDIPAVALLDAGGTPYFIDGFFPNDADEYIKRLNLLATEHKTRDDKLKLAAGNLNAAEEALKWLRERRISRFYGGEIDKWLRLARKADPKNEQGKLELFFEEDWQVRVSNAVYQERSQLTKVLQDVLEWSQEHKFQDSDRAVRILLAATRGLIELDESADAFKTFEVAQTYSPRDPKLKEALQGLLKFFASRKQLSSGSGFVVSETGFILTNYHVIEGPGRTVVRKPDSDVMIDAKIVAKDEDRDMALLQIDPEKFGELRPLSLASGGVNRGSRVAVFGYPLGDAIGTGLKFNPGHVMGLPEPSNKDMLLIDGRINPGNSGGPLLNGFSKVVGMVTAKSHGGDGLDSYGMAIPASELRKFIAQHLPNYSPPPDQSRDPKDALEWDQVDANVKDSVLMVLKLKAN